MTIGVENLSYQVTQEDLKEVFAYGSVKSLIVPTDRETGKIQGFVFRGDGGSSSKRCGYLEGMGRQMRVNKAKPKENSRPTRDRGRL
jgi:hypothetical protein